MHYLISKLYISATLACSNSAMRQVLVCYTCSNSSQKEVLERSNTWAKVVLAQLF